MLTLLTVILSYSYSHSPAHTLHTPTYHLGQEQQSFGAGRQVLIEGQGGGHGGVVVRWWGARGPTGDGHSGALHARCAEGLCRGAGRLLQQRKLSLPGLGSSVVLPGRGLWEGRCTQETGCSFWKGGPWWGEYPWGYVYTFTVLMDQGQKNGIGVLFRPSPFWFRSPGGLWL